MKYGPWILAIGMSGLAHAETLSLSLSQVEQWVLNQSEKLKASAADVVASEERGRGATSALFPKLSIEGTYKYSATVPEMVLPTGAKIKTTDNTTYTVGPTLSYVVFDAGQTRGLSRAQDAQIESKKWTLANDRRELVFNTRNAYHRAVLSSERMRLLCDSVALAISQERDTERRFRVGAAQNIDRALARKYVAEMRMRFLEAQAEFSTTLIELASSMGHPEIVNADQLRRPAPVSIVDRLVGLGFESPTVTLRLDAPEMGAMAIHSNPMSAHPRLRALASLGTSYDESAKASFREHFPKISVSGRSSLDYPNGSKEESFIQHAAWLSLSWPLYEGGRVLSGEAEKRALELKTKYEAREWQRLLERDLEKATSDLELLRSEHRLGVLASREADDVATLTALAYQHGRMTLTGVQEAHLKALEAKVNVAMINAKIRMDETMIRYLTEED